MRIAVLSGKGGTGKTTVAASLSQVIPDSQYLDCDVEEPNGSLFLRPESGETQVVTVLVPVVDSALCTLCGDCARICRFHAIAVPGRRVLVFPGLCHHCGACGLACKPYAITEEERRIGIVKSNPDRSVVQGLLDVGEPTGVPLIAALLKQADPTRTAILDCAPGASCGVVRSLEGSDYAVLITEPTPFGLHDLAIAVDLVRGMGIPAGVVLNKAGAYDRIIRDYCDAQGLPVLMAIPFSRELAEYYSRGLLPTEMGPEWKDRFLALWDRIRQEMHT